MQYLLCHSQCSHTAPLLHVPQRQTVVSFTQDASAHNRPFDRMHSGDVCIEKKFKKKKAFIWGKELSSANCLDLTQTSQVITAVLTSCSNRNSFHLSATVVYRLDGGWCFPRVSGTQWWKPLCRQTTPVHGSYRPFSNCRESRHFSSSGGTSLSVKLLPLISNVTSYIFLPIKVTCQDPNKSGKLQSTQDGVINKRCCGSLGTSLSGPTR